MAWNITNSTLITTNGDMFYETSTHTLARLAAGKAGAVLKGEYTPIWGGISQPSNLPEWWRYDGCGHAVAFKAKGEMQLNCPHCGCQMPTRYDP